MPLIIDPAIETKVQNLQFLFERYVKNASANCDVLGSLGGLLGDVKLDIPDFGGETGVGEVFGKIKDGVSDTIKQISQSTKFLQDKASEIAQTIKDINLLEGIISPTEFQELQLEIENIQSSVIDFANELTIDITPAIDAYFNLELQVANSLEIIRSINCPIVNDALAEIAPGLTPFLNDISESVKNESVIRDTILKRNASGAIGNITNKVQGITSKFQGRLNTISNTTRSLNRIKQKIQGFF